MTKKKRPTDISSLAYQIVQEATGQAPEEPKPDKEKNPAAVALGRLGGLKGGNARKEKLSPERRKEIAQKAAKSRWSNTFKEK
jgi:hypothetical protein